MAARVSWKGEEHLPEASEAPPAMESPGSVRRHAKSQSVSHGRSGPSLAPNAASSPELSGNSLEGSDASSEEEGEAETIRVPEAHGPPEMLKDLGRAQSLPIATALTVPIPANIFSTSPTFSPQNVQRFTTIASGHSDFFKLGDDKLAKPCNPHEAKVYAALNHCAPLHPFLAKFHGFMPSPNASNSNMTVKSHGKQDASQFIVLQDLTYGFTHPCVMDLKMGTSQSTRSQSAAKKKWRSAKVNATTSAKLGVRLGGIRVYKPYLKEWVVRKGNYGKRLTESTFMDALTLFFNDGRRTRLELISSFIERLKSFLAAMEAARPDFDFIASSVLLIYEGSYDRSSLREKHEPPRCDVRLIDFDHTVIKADTPDSANDDSGARIGIRNLIHTLDTLLFSHTRTHSFTELPTVKLTAVVQEVKKMPDSDERLLKLMPAHPKKEFPRWRRVNSQP